MRILIFAESPLQIINAWELIRGRGSDEYACVCYSANRKTRIVVERAWKRMFSGRFEVLHYSSTALLRYLNIMQMWRIVADLRHYDAIILGNLASPLQRVVMLAAPHCCVYAVDDGNNTTRALSSVREMHHDFFECMKFGARLAMLGGFPGRARVRLFTMYKGLPVLDNFAYYENKNLRLSLGFLSKEVTEDVVFIGCCLVEVGGVMEQDYESILTSFVRDFKDTAGRIVYYPHRREDVSRRRTFIESLGIVWKEPEVCLEIDMLMAAGLPGAFVSVYSTALEIMLRLAGEKVRIFSYRIDESLFCTEKIRQEANSSYARYEKIGINVIT